MIIKEACKDWTMEYNNPSLPELEDSPELSILSSVLHLSGDVVAAYNNIPKDVTPEFKELLLDSLAVILTDTKENIIDCINSSVSAHALSVPLDKGYSEEEVFGLNLVTKFKEILPEPELQVAAEHFHALQDEAWGEDDDDDDSLV